MAKATATKSKTSSKTKSATTKAKTTKAKVKKPLVLLDETGNREGSERRTKPVAAPAKRRKATRRRQIDPTTCEREYTESEIQFMHAMDEYKKLSGRMFPTCSEILEVLTKLGYRQIADQQSIYDPEAEAQAAAAATQEETLDNVECEEDDDF